MAVDPMMLAAGPAMPDAPVPPGLGAPPMAPPMGPMPPAEAVMQAVMGLVPQQQAAMQGMTLQTQDAVMQALMGASNPQGLAAVTGPVAPGALEGAEPSEPRGPGAPMDGLAEGESEVY